MHSYIKVIYINSLLAIDVLTNLIQGTRELYNMLGLFYICSVTTIRHQKQKEKNQMAVMV